MCSLAAIVRSIQLSSEAAIRMRQWLAANPQPKHGEHRYSFEQFGLDEAKIKDKFASYYES